MDDRIEARRPSIGVAAVLPIILLLVTSVVSRYEVDTLDWDVLILIAGGLTLGYSLQAPVSLPPHLGQIV